MRKIYSLLFGRAGKGGGGQSSVARWFFFFALFLGRVDLCGFYAGNRINLFVRGVREGEKVQTKL